MAPTGRIGNAKLSATFLERNTALVTALDGALEKSVDLHLRSSSAYPIVRVDVGNRSWTL